MQRPNCNAPVERECKTGCEITLTSDGKQSRNCAQLDMQIAFLDENDKKCTKIDYDGTSRTVCFCNYDGCNENTDDQTNNHILTGLGKDLKCSFCYDNSRVGVM